ncbi:uncharacterized protein [Nicotiana sylvestris]|uniref:uncharacterized protein n=1 Tax=Nicotiana sylvestris TaxID=4096 RepID=UPI00388C900A
MDVLIKNLAEELKKLTSQIQGVEGSKGIKGMKYEDLCIQPDVELPEGYKPPKFEMFDGTGDSRFHLRTYCDKLVGVGKDERIDMKLFMRSLKGDVLSCYISQDPKKWSRWVGMASDFMDRFRCNTENAPDVFYILNLKKKPMETFREYATRWRSEAAKVKPALEEDQMNKFFVRAQDPQYHERLILIEYHKLSYIIKLGERIEEEGDDLKKPTITLNPTIVQIQSFEETEVNMSIPLEFEATPSAKAPVPIEVEFMSPANAPAPFEVAVLPLKAHVPFEVRIAVSIPMEMSTMTPFYKNVVPWDYTAEARRKGKVTVEETMAAQGMTRTGRVYTPEHLAESSKQASNRPPLIEIGPDDLWRKIWPKEYSIIDQLNKIPEQISILSLLQNAEIHKNSLLKVLNEAYVPSNITSEEVANMVGQDLESHKITFYEDELPPEGLGHNKTLHIIVQYEDYFITRILIYGGSNLNICPLVTLKKLGKGLHDIKDGSINVKSFDGSLRSTIVRCLYNITITYLDEPMTVTCNETTQQTYMDSEEDGIPDETVKEVENFENIPESNLDETKTVNLGDAKNIKET